MILLRSSDYSGFTLEPLGSDAHHFIRCPRGLRAYRLQGTRVLHGNKNHVSDRVRDELANIRERCNISGSSLIVKDPTGR